MINTSYVILLHDLQYTPVPPDYTRSTQSLRTQSESIHVHWSRRPFDTVKILGKKSGCVIFSQDIKPAQKRPPELTTLERPSVLRGLSAFFGPETVKVKVELPGTVHFVCEGDGAF